MIKINTENKNNGHTDFTEAFDAYIEANNERIEREVTNWWAYVHIVF